MALNQHQLELALASAADFGPRWRSLAQALAQMIDAGTLAEGAMLPPERDLAGLAKVSRVTVRTALQHLVEEGRLIRRQGSGTYVAPAKRQSPHSQPLISLTEDIRRRGQVPSSRWLLRGLHLPMTDEIMALGLTVNARVARLERVRLADGKPLAVSRSALPEDLLPDPGAVEASLFEYLVARGLRPERAVQRMSAANATPRDAEALGILPGVAVLRVERITYLPSGRAVEFSRALYRGDAYDVVSELR